MNKRRVTGGRRLSLVGAAVVACVWGWGGSAPGAQPLADAPGLAPPPASVGGKGLKEWLADIRDRDPGVRDAAIRAVVHFNQAAAETVPYLLHALSDTDVNVRHSAVTALGMVPIDKKDQATVITQMSRLLQDGQASIRLQTVTVLSRFGQDARGVIPSLVATTLQDRSSWEVRKATVFTLGALGADSAGNPDARAIAALIQAAADPCAQVRLEAVMSLIGVGPSPRAQEQQNVTQVMHRLMQDRDKVVSLWARVGVMRWERKVSEVHLQEIGRLLKSEDAAVRGQAARALGSIGMEAKSRIPDLVDALKDKDPGVVVWAVGALALMGNEARSAVPSLEKLAAEHGDEAVKEVAKEAAKYISGQSGAGSPGGDGPPLRP